MVRQPAADDGVDRYRPGYSVAAERIIEYIEQRGLGPGDRLPTEAEFAALLGVSRGIARDAIKTLAAVGRVSTERGRGIFVAEPPLFSHELRSRFRLTDLDGILMMFEFRALLEGSAAELAAARATPTELRSIEGAMNEYAALVPQRDAATSVPRPDYDALTECDREFHERVIAASHNPFLMEATFAVRQLQREVVSVALGGFSGGSLEDAVSEHRAIFDAVRRGEAEAARVAAAAHVGHTSRNHQQELARRMFDPGE